MMATAPTTPRHPATGRRGAAVRRAYRDALDVAARQLGTTWGVGRG